MLVHREHLLGLFVSLLTFYRKGALFSMLFGFYWIINTPELECQKTSQCDQCLAEDDLLWVSHDVVHRDPVNRR
ncbi:hypothetical protein E5Z46_09495 [Geobacillus kaustophilus NBRC 102445]|nr:hypothetical protein E5Z46_09495 [Geobacillus kaustophilus NBRC 102445]